MVIKINEPNSNVSNIIIYSKLFEAFNILLQMVLKLVKVALIAFDQNRLIETIVAVFFLSNTHSMIIFIRLE